MSLGTQEMKIILLLYSGKVSRLSINSEDDFSSTIPLAFATELVLDIVDCVTGGRIAFAVLSSCKLVAEGFIVLFGGNFINDNLLLVIGDLEDDELRLLALAAAGHAEVVELGEAVIGNGNSK